MAKRTDRRGRPAGRRAALAALCALGALGATRSAPAQTERRVDWTDITLIDGRVLRAGQLRAAPVVVEVWATWCPFCKKQNPHLQKLHETAGGKGLLVLTFAIDRDIELVRAYQRRYGYTFAAAQTSPQVERWFGKRRSLPELYVVDARGRLVLREEGEMFPEDIAALARFAAGA
jgi:thiol-disulfide isomerase/thioredoxin